MKVHHIIMAGAIAALSTATALAQMAPRAQMEQLRTQYKTAALNDLSADHRAKVQAILAQVHSGSLDPRTAATQIDIVLTPAEAQAVLGEAQKLHADMKKAMANARPPHRMIRKPDAGRFLMMLSRPPGPPPGAPGQP